MTTDRKSGVLLPVFSLPGPYGIGVLGADARRFVDFLASAGQSWWQILPLNPIGPGNSPYMSPSAFEGNPLLLDPQELCRLGLLTDKELAKCRYADPDRVNYEWLRKNRLPLLKLAVRRAGDAGFLQKEFLREWTELKTYANEKGVSILGDLPIYVSPLGKEVAERPELFQLDAQGKPARVAGVPPDAFTELGQLWGNPLYDWEGHREEVFAWWGKRVRHAAALYDGVRIDHFRGFHTYWSIPAGAEDARLGRWEPGPGQALVDFLRESAPGLLMIAEDLGDLDGEALAFLRSSGLPGMNVLQFAFDPNSYSAYLPHNCKRGSVMYTGTHDNATFVQWLFGEAGEAERGYAMDYLRLDEKEGFGWGAVRGAWASPCFLAIAPMQDILGLGADARLNTPGVLGGGNWSWRVRAQALNDSVAGRLRRLTRLYQRL